MTLILSITIVVIFLLVALLLRGLILMRRSEYPGPVGCWICGATDGKHDVYCSRPDGDI